MDDLQQREAAMREHAERVNAGRKPAFGDRMRNLWAGEENPIRDGIFVRAIRRNHASLYQMTNGKGKFWEVFTSGMVFIETDRAACAADCEERGNE